MTQVLYAGYIERPDWGIKLREAQHDGLVSMRTFRKIQDRLAARLSDLAKAPVRKNLQEEMPLHGFVQCGDRKRPLTGARIKGQLRELDAKIETIVNRTLETSSATLITCYEQHLRDLEQEKAALIEQSALPTKPLDTFERTFRTAMAFLDNPLKLWNSSRFEDKRAVLKLTFADQLAYKQNEGFRTANFSLPFKLLGDFSTLESKMALPEGLEPSTCRLEVDRSIQLS